MLLLQSMLGPIPLPADLGARLERVGRRCAAVPGLVAAVVFGSVARGQATPWSDVDIAVLCEGVLPLDEQLSLSADATSLLGRDVDVVDLRRVPIALRGQAVREGRELAVANRDAWTSFVTFATLEWLDFAPTYYRAIEAELARWRA
jgi:predicted nucleotidyltransferase